MRVKFKVWLTLAKGVLLEALRRKDMYVVAILAFIIIAGAGTVGFFGVQGIEVFAKDLAFGVISLFASLLCILITSRQLPEEIKHRTLYPLLSRPITRLDFLIGKFLGAYFVSALAFLILIAVGCLAMWRFHLSLGSIVWQYILLKLFALWMLTAITLALSLITTPAANVTFCILFTVGAGTISRGLLLSYEGMMPITRFLSNILYYVLPHVDLFDLGKKVAYGWPPVPIWVIGTLALYAVLYSTAMLTLGWLKFNRQAV